MKKFLKCSAVFIFAILAVLLFYPFFLKGLMPYPGNYMMAWFEPWKTDHFVNGIITLVHKPIADDIFRQLYPFRVLGINLLKQLQPPLWNPYNGAGMPLLATVNTGILDPFNFLYFFLPNAFAWSVYIVMQPFLIGLAAYFYCQSLAMSKKASVFSAVVFTLSGVVVVRYIYGIFGFAFALLPFSLFFIENFFHNNKSKKVLFLPLCIATLFVITQPQIALYIVLFLGCYIVIRGKETKLTKKQYFLFAFLFLLGCGLAAVQLLPTAELYHYANITTQSSAFIFEKCCLCLPYKNREITKTTKKNAVSLKVFLIPTR